MKKKDEQQDYFEAEPHGQEIQEIIVPKNSLLMGEANPIYSRKLQPYISQYDGPITLKMVPILQKQQIVNYIPFSLSRMKKDTKVKQDEQQKIRQERLIKIHNLLSSKQNMFTKAYENAQIIYCKFDNHRYNYFRDVSYFAGIFLPKDILAKKFKNLQERGINPYTIQTVLKKQRKNKQLLLTNKQKMFYSAPTNMNPQAAVLGNNKTYRARDKLLFDSNFECGNLFTVFRTGKFCYDLILNNDVNSKGSTQWFYFSIEGFQANVDYQLSIVNFTKNDSLFNYGMKPVLYSLYQNNGIQPHLQKQQRFYEQRCGWYRYGKDVQYYKNQIQRQNSNRYYYTLNFTINWRYAGDKLYIAHSYPYTHTRMQNIFKSIMLRYEKKQIDIQTGRPREQRKVTIEKIKLGQTIGRRQIHAYLIGYKKSKKQKNKQCVIIMARQHPGQTQGSFVCQGIINKLTENQTSKQVKFILQNYYVYVIPMINPDGVVFGNYRCNLSGKDLNRKWDSSDNNSVTPQVTAVKQFLINLTGTANMNIKFVLDLHGHSKKLNSFFYGNPCPQNPQSTKIFPYICSRFSEKVQFMDCTFSTQEYKKKAARIYISSLYKQLHVYTFQCSFYGFSNRSGKIIQFTPLQYIKLGEVLINSLYLFLLRDKQKISTSNLSQQSLQNQQKISNQANEISLHKSSIQMLHKIQSQLIQNQLLLKVGDADSSGSQSRPQQGQVDNQQIMYASEEEQFDERVVINHKYINKSQLQKDRQRVDRGEKGEKIDISKTKSIRINNRKPVQQNTIEYKDKCKQYRNKKIITLSQVNAVLPDKYHISLLPIQRVGFKAGKSTDAECQTDKQQKLIIKQYKLFQIEEKNNLVGSMEYLDQHTQDISKSFFAQRSYGSKNGQQKKHSQIVAEIQRNSRHQMHRQSSQIQKQLINRRKLSQALNLKPMIIKKQIKSKKVDVFTQTIATIRNPESKYIRGIIMQSPTKQMKISDNQVRIAKMQKINQEVLKIYSKKSHIIDLNLKYQTENASKSEHRQNF